MEETSRHKEFRAECRRIGERRWRFIPFTGSGPTFSRERVEQAIATQAQVNSVPYEYRIMTREKTITVTSWEMAP